jgi:hypothetical protein
LHSRPDAFINGFATLLVGHWETDWRTFVPVLSTEWMADVRFKQWLVRFNLSVAGNNLSFSPHAFWCIVSGGLGVVPWHAASKVVGISALIDSFNIGSHHCWGTIVVFWNQIESIVECTRAWALSFIISKTNSPVISSGITVHLDWMAEFFREEHLWTSLVSVIVCVVLIVLWSALIFAEGVVERWSGASHVNWDWSWHASGVLGIID